MNASDLDHMKCSTPGCKHNNCSLFLVQRCHPRAGVEVCYHKGTNKAEVSCKQCHEHVCTLELFNPESGRNEN